MDSADRAAHHPCDNVRVLSGTIETKPGQFALRAASRFTPFRTYMELMEFNAVQSEFTMQVDTTVYEEHCIQCIHCTNSLPHPTDKGLMPFVSCLAGADIRPLGV